MSSWQCPFCEHYAILENMTKKTTVMQFHNSAQGNVTLRSFGLLCSNPDCAEISVSAHLNRSVLNGDGDAWVDELIDEWVLRPQAQGKTFPDVIPKAIINDYNEACLIQDLSPKASATLSRRCLQGMIRDFWEVKERTLYDEINAVKDRVPSDTWEAIDAIRQIGNIGAHMEKDIDLIIDVQPMEAKLLIQLIESLLKDWYVERANRKERTSAIIAAAKAKKDMKPS